MNTNSFRSTLNSAASKCENDMRVICGMGEKNFGPSDPLLPPLNAQEKQEMMALIAVSGRDGFTQEMKNKLDFLVRRWMAYGNPDPRIPANPPADDQPGPAQGAAGVFLLSILPWYLSIPVAAIVIYNYRKNFSQLKFLFTKQ